MRVLAVNPGSSSLKLSVLDDGQRTAADTIERWAGADHLEPVHGFVDAAGDLDGIAVRVVHGGPLFDDSVLVDDDVERAVEAACDLAPLHNPRSLAGIRMVRRALPQLPVVACFDTTFHAAMPRAARTYALPTEWNERWQLRRYGFHGLSHAYAVRRAAALLELPLPGLRVVSCHLGAGSSLAAVVGGRSVDTTMGFTPLEGLVMATRSGTVDPGLLLWLQQSAGVPLDRLAHALEKGSGLSGLSGTGGDLRDVVERRDAGDVAAALAFDVFVHRLRREAGAMAASAGGLDVLVLTGGIGEHQAEVRAELAAGLAHLGVAVDREANEAAAGDADLSAGDAGASTVVVSAAEDVEMAREAERLLVARRRAPGTDR